MSGKYTIDGVGMSKAAARNVEETGISVALDVVALRTGGHTEESLLAHCLNGAEDDRAGGWHDYVAAVVGASPWTVVDRLEDRAVVSRHETYEDACEAATALGCGSRFAVREVAS